MKTYTHLFPPLRKTVKCVIKKMVYTIDFELGLTCIKKSIYSENFTLRR